ncbi:MAG: cache domain-containing protein [Proteobacteria bacterium]|nr:cache domain-containing protein [Pseudomonadota bacterium]
MFIKTKIRWKIIFSSFTIMLSCVTLITLFVVITMKSNANRELNDYRFQAKQEVRENLKNYVDIAYKTIVSNYIAATDKEYLKERYGKRMKNVVSVAVSFVRDAQKRVKAGEISVKRAKTQVAEQIRKMRYDKGSGYLWINDTGRPLPLIIMHPIAPALEGTVMDHPKYNVALGKNRNMTAAFVDVTETSEEGYVDYVWPKPGKDGTKVNQPKLSYVRRIPEWNWIIGTGIYVDDALKDAIVKTKNDIGNMRYDQGNGFFWINDTGTPIPSMVMHSLDKEMEGQVLDNPKFNRVGEERSNVYVAMVEKVKADQNGYLEYTWPKVSENGEEREHTKLAYFRLFEPLNWIIGTELFLDEIEARIAARRADVNNQIFGLIFRIIAIVVVISFLAFLALLLVARTISRPIESGSDIAEQISLGDLSVQITNEQQDEIGKLLKAMQKMIDSLKEKADITARIAEGDLSSDVVLASEKDVLGRTLQTMINSLKTKAFQVEEIARGNLALQVETISDRDRLGCALVKMVESLNELLFDVNSAAEELASGSNQISTTSQNLAVGASQQAASLEEISSSMEELKRQSDSNLNNASSVKDVSANSKTKAEKIKTQLAGMLSAMKDINTTAEQISAIVKTIDEIAFQTSVLSINAAVEAARAGEKGKGFAVVAEEVRSLAQRSAQASKETNSMVLNSIATIEKGVLRANETAGSVTDIIEGSSSINELIETIEVASREQAIGTQQINDGLSELNGLVQDNAAAAEESASSSTVLDNQAKLLKSMVAKFNLDDRPYQKDCSQITSMDSDSRIIQSISDSGKRLLESSALHTDQVVDKINL